MLSALALSLLLAADPGAAPPAGTAREVSPMEVRKVTDALLCQCSCNMGLSECSHEQCPFALPERAAIAKRLAAGETPEAIIASYEKQYGSRIRAAPKRTGFGLVAWLAPFAVLGVGGVIVVRVIRGWVRPAAAGGTPAAKPTPVAQALLDSVEADLKREDL